MEHGKIIEFDTPSNLLKNENGFFAKLVKENGPEFEETMIFLAKHKEVDIDELND